MKVYLEKGRTPVAITIPDEKVSGVLIGKDVPGVSHGTIKEIISDGIRSHCPQDIARKTVAIIIPDDTRLWTRGDLFVPVIVESLFNLGVAKDRIKIIIALGTHAEMDAEKFPQLAGAFSAGSVEILNSANRNQDRLVSYGKTSRNTALHFTKEAAAADHIIIFGGVLHHLIAGFGGGRKYILPGIAGYDAIHQNHSLAIQKDGTPHPMAQLAVLGGNPIHEDAMEAADLFLRNKTCTHVAIAANGSGEIFHCEVGPLHTSFLDVCKKLDGACGIEVPEKGDFALISAGGHRTDGQLYQAVKALFNAVNVVKEGGDILLAAGCSQGVGNDTFAAVLREHDDTPQELGDRLTAHFTMPAYVAFRLRDVLRRFRVGLLSDLGKSLTEELGFHAVDDIGAYIERIRGKGYIIPYAANILPAPARSDYRLSQ